MTKVKLGDKVKCKITGFIGTAVAKTEYINGCIQFQVLPKCGKDGKMQEELSLDEQCLEVILVKKKKKIKKENNGGPIRLGLKMRGF